MSEQRLIQLGSADNVAVVPSGTEAGLALRADDVIVVSREPIPAGHKVALRHIAEGDQVKKYGESIGRASSAIEPGEHVHTHNLTYESRTHGEPVHIDPPPRPQAQSARTWEGFVRKDGRVGNRNYVGVISTVNCSATVARAIAARFSDEHIATNYPNVDGVVALTHTLGCGMGSDGLGLELLRRTIEGYMRHPNFGGVLVLGLGCEVNAVESYGRRLADESGTLFMTIQDAGGTQAAIELGVQHVRQLLSEASVATRSTVPASELIVAGECGGSDAFSGISANPVVGAALDLVVAQGGRSVFGETPEIYGAEHILMRRAVSTAVRDKLAERIAWWEEYTSDDAAGMNNNPSPGNKAGGLSTILEKSLGAIAKGGTAPLAAVYEYASPIDTPGLGFMDTPGYDPVSVTGLVAGGVNVVLFTTGRGSVFGCKPVPSLKLASNSGMFERMAGDMDLNCGRVVDGSATVAQLGEELFELILATASGQKTRSEFLGFGDHEFVPWQIGAVM